MDRKRQSQSKQQNQVSQESLEEVDQPHMLKLSIDLQSISPETKLGNLNFAYQLQLNGQPKSFRTQTATSIPQSQIESKIENGFASYEFNATKSELLSILAANSQVEIKIFNQDNQIAQVILDLKEILSAPLKQSPTSIVRVSDQNLMLLQKDKRAGTLRVIMYLEDMGAAITTNQTNLEQPTNLQQQQPIDYQVVWQLEMWKRAEMAKFLVYLKQKEIDRIEQVTSDWRQKEIQRDSQFQESLLKVYQQESKLRQKAVEIQKREERIIQLEEELKNKINEVTRQLTQKEDEIFNIKVKFKEERQQTEIEKKRMTKEITELHDKLQQASNRFFALKTDVESSPLQVLRQELGQKQLEISELHSQVQGATAAADEYKTKFELLKKEMISLKKQIDENKEQQLTKQANELEQLKQMIRVKQVQDQEKAQYDDLKQQLTTLKTNLTRQQDSQEVEKPLKQPTSILSKDRSIYFDDFARQQQSPTRTKEEHRHVVPQSFMLSHKTQPKEEMEWDRLMKEREELLSSGLYSKDDLLIRELERQINASQKNQAKQQY